MTEEKVPSPKRSPIKSNWKIWIFIAVGILILFLLFGQTSWLFIFSLMSFVVITVTELFYGKNNWIKLILVLGYILVIVIIAHQWLEPPTIGNVFPSV